MDPSDECYKLIQSFEGCELTAYRDPVGVLTIGFGHTSGVVEGQTITLAEAEALLRQDVKNFSEAVETSVHVPLTQAEFDALVSFVYNVGTGAFSRSTMLRLLNAGNFAEAANQFPLWVHAGGSVLPGLVRRRAAERQLFLRQET